METKPAPVAQRSLEKLHFDHKDMDYYYSWILGRQVYRGSDPRECLEVASRIVDGDPGSWGREWLLQAERVEEQAERAFDAGDREAARGAYQRASTYYRAPLFLMHPQDPAFREDWRKMHACFQRAATLFNPPIETIQVPFRGKLLPGYFWKVDDRDQKRPTLIVIGGLETFVEDCYFITGQTGPERGYNVLAADLPGQGLNPDQGMYLEARMEAPVKAVVDYALARPEVDPERLAAYGFSWGGHIVFKGAQADPRIKALIANPAMPDVFRAARAQQANHGRGDRIARLVIEQIAWRMGLKVSYNPGDILRRFAKAYDYFVYGKARPAEIGCPALCLAGEGEARITLEVARECYQQLPHPQKKLIIFTREQGGEAHCQVNNLALPNRVMFDWLDEVFERS